MTSSADGQADGTPLSFPVPAPPASAGAGEPSPDALAADVAAAGAAAVVVAAGAGAVAVDAGAAAVYLLWQAVADAATSITPAKVTATGIRMASPRSRPSPAAGVTEGNQAPVTPR
jgi:hypothetical protein